MSNSYWLSYDGRDERRRRRRWPWLLALLAVLMAIAVPTIILGFTGVSDSVDLAEPTAIQEALPALLTDRATVVYVVDDSGSMWEKLSPLHEALHEVAVKDAVDSEITMLKFGGSHERLFDFRDPKSAPWDTAIPSFTADSGRTNMYSALQGALGIMPANPTCFKQTKWVFFQETICRERRIVLMSDGIATDPHLAQEAFAALSEHRIPVDTIAFGQDADEKGLRDIAAVTGGRFVAAY